MFTDKFRSNLNNITAHLFIYKRNVGSVLQLPNINQFLPEDNNQFNQILPSMISDFHFTLFKAVTLVDWPTLVSIDQL